MKSEYEEWQDELAGHRPRSSWWLVALALGLVAFAIWGLRL